MLNTSSLFNHIRILAAGAFFVLQGCSSGGSDSSNLDHLFESSSSSSSFTYTDSGVPIPAPDDQYTGGLALGHSKFLGNVIASSIPSNFGHYWNQVTPENAGKWGSVEAVQGVMNWVNLDRAYGYAKANNMPFKLHTLVWGSQEPDWVAGLSTSDQRIAVENWISQLAARYPDVEMIDVVNEALHQPPSYAEALGGDGDTGWDWVIESFRLAEQYFPNAELHLNDYGIISNASNLDSHKAIATLLQTEGLIDGIAIQCHAFNVNDMSASEITASLDSLGQLNLPIHISELDVDDTSSVNQAEVYAEIFPALWEHPSVQGITLWGYIEGQTWRNDTNSGILRDDGSEKPAMLWLRDYFNSF